MVTIQELADAAGVTTRTIRYYVEQGVLPPPGHGRPAEYTEEHVQRLDLIRRLKEQYLPLEEIRDMLQRLTPREVERLAEQYTPRPEEREQGLSSAADYISGVLGRGQAREELKRIAPPPAPVNVPPPEAAPPAPSAPPMAPPSTARGGWLRGMRPPFGRPADGEKRIPRPAPVPPAKASAPMSPARHVAEEAVTYSPDLFAPAAEESSTLPEPEQWQRVTLAPGVELHYIPSDDARLNELVTRIIQAARPLPEDTPENGE
jgi:DNA-binding transcriptional MerR regulator